MSARRMENQLFNLKFTAKQLTRESKKCEKDAKKEKIKLKKAIEAGNTDGAKIYAQNAIRQKNQALNYLRLSSRIDAVAARVNTAVKMNRLTKTMGGIVSSMDKVMKTMNIEKISNVMDQFEQQFENLDLNSEYMENAMQSSTSAAMPESEVDNLMQEVADEHGLEFSVELDKMGTGKKQVVKKKAVTDDESDLEERLKRLQGI
uniref:Charged multivesicular body protein 1b n=1 Tax=Hirondellea gigas TaxID=1518452 RepID=A0A2P2I3P6_9CRUS